MKRIQVEACTIYHYIYSICLFWCASSLEKRLTPYQDCWVHKSPECTCYYVAVMLYVCHVMYIVCWAGNEGGDRCGVTGLRARLEP